MPYLHLGNDVVVQDEARWDDGDYTINDVLIGLTGDPPPVLYAAPHVEVHDVQTLPEIVAVAKPVNWLLIAALAAGLWALSKDKGGTMEW